MSHFAAVKTQIKDIQILKDTLNQLGIAFEEKLQGQGLQLKTRWTQYNKPTYAHLIIRQETISKLGGNSCQADIGFVRNAEGNYEIVSDSYELRGENQTLIQRISGLYARKTVEALGFEVEEVQTGHGQYRLRVLPGRTVATRR